MANVQGLVYRHQPLRELETRLVCVLPGSWSDPLSIDIRPFSLELGKVPFYEAISYVWGSQQNKIAIDCSGYILEVGKAVSDIIRRFRLADVIRLLWIDAIVINQEDIQERSAQVQMMNIIYQRASRVLIYLGEADASSDHAMDALAERHSAKASTQKYVIDFLETRPWFSRVWVLQEVALAEVAIVVCGSKCVSWACFPAWWARNAAALEHSNGPPSTFAYDPVALKRTSLLQQLYDTRFSQATDPRDKVYALIGLLSPEDRLSVFVDYSLPASEVYIHSAKAIIKREQSLRLLSGVQPGDRIQDLPSWVPDWVQTSPIVSLGLSNHFLEPFDAGGSPTCNVSIESSTLGSVLTCMGITLDFVQRTGTLCPLKEPEEALVSVLNEWALMATLADFEFLQNESAVDRVLYSSGQFWPVDLDSDTFWTTVLAQSAPTVELSSVDVQKRKSRPAKVEDLKFCLGRRLITTSSGFIGLAPAATQPGDLVVILLGGPVPHVLRKEGEQYRLIGECYVNGVMGGEALAHLSGELGEIGHRCRPYKESKSDALLEWFAIR